MDSLVFILLTTAEVLNLPFGGAVFILSFLLLLDLDLLLFPELFQVAGHLQNVLENRMPVDCLRSSAFLLASLRLVARVYGAFIGCKVADTCL